MDNKKAVSEEAAFFVYGGNDGSNDGVNVRQ